jgi:hypothetical protein
MTPYAKAYLTRIVYEVGIAITVRKSGGIDNMNNF